MLWHGDVLLQAVSKLGPHSHKATAPVGCRMLDGVIHCALLSPTTPTPPPTREDPCRTAEAIAEFVTERSGLPVGKIERTPLISAR